MIKKHVLKVGNNVKIISGKYRDNIFVIKKVNKGNETLSLDGLSRTRFVMNRKEGKRFAKEIFIPIHVSNVKLVKKDNK